MIVLRTSISWLRKSYSGDVENSVMQAGQEKEEHKNVLTTGDYGIWDYFERETKEFYILSGKVHANLT